MFYRRTMLSLLAFASLTASCRLFRPINPSAPRGAKPSAPKPSDAKPSDAKPSDAKPSAAKPSAAKPAPSAAAQKQAAGMTDANIAAMVLASNNTDISYARLVPTRADRADIKEFAQRMLTDHMGVNGLVTELLAKLDLAPEDNTSSLDMRDESANKRDILRELSGYPFDSTYIENEVSYHRKFLASIDNVMLPRAGNTQLRNLLTSVRPAVAAHLAHAEQVRANVLSKK